MTDLVERLRKPEIVADVPEMMREAAGEIERWKRLAEACLEENERLRALVHPFEGAVAKIEEQGREIERLRRDLARLQPMQQTS